MTGSGYVTTGANNAFTGDNSFSGAVTLATATDENGHSGGFIPAGCILLWSGAVSAIPTGWVICDGANSTPNLTDRFVIHADNDSGGTNDVDDTGGASTASLSVANLPAHTHGSAGAHTHGSPVTSIRGNGGTDTVSGTSNKAPDQQISSSGAHTHTSVGSGTAHANRDKYYALAYIMKT